MITSGLIDARKKKYNFLLMMDTKTAQIRDNVTNTVKFDRCWICPDAVFRFPSYSGQNISKIYSQYKLYM